MENDHDIVPRVLNALLPGLKRQSKLAVPRAYVSIVQKGSSKFRIRIQQIKTLLEMLDKVLN